MLRSVVWKLSLHVVLTSALIYVIFVAILKKKKLCWISEASEMKPKHENQKSFMGVLRPE